MKRWEYKWIGCPWGEYSDNAAQEREAFLNQLGLDGWELVDVYTGDTGIRYIFKREIA